MPRIERSVAVEAPAERVWAFVSDVRRCPEWVTFADGMGHVDEGDPGEGFRYVEYGGVGPLRSANEWVISSSTRRDGRSTSATWGSCGQN